jgi:hypothetical protein
MQMTMQNAGRTESNNHGMLGLSRFRRVCLAIGTTALLAVGVGCGDAGAEKETEQTISYEEFKPFDEQNMANQWLRLEAHSQIDDLAGDATLSNATEQFSAISEKYETVLAEKVAGRTDDHVQAEGYGVENVGVFLDAQISAAIELGKSAQTEADVEYAGQIVDKALMVFFYHSVYHELFKRHRKNFDEAFGYYGLNFDGTPREIGVLPNTAAGREAEFQLKLNEPIFHAFIDARHAMAEATETNDDKVADDNAAYNEAWETIDRKMLLTLGHYAAHEVVELDSEPAVKLLEARVIWEAVAAYAAHVDAETAQRIMDAMYPGGVPSRDSADYFLVGLDKVRDGSVEIDDEALLSDMLTIMDTLKD